MKINSIRDPIQYVLLLSLFLSGLAGCQTEMQRITPSTVSPTLTPTYLPLPSTPSIYTINIDTNDVRQTIRDVGSGNFIHEFGGVFTALDPVSTLNVETLQPMFSRVAIDLELWEPKNDNEDPYQIAKEGFKDSGYNHATLQLLEKFKEQPVTIVASIWHVPDWMVSDPTDSSALVIPPDKVPEAIESIVAWLLTARDDYGVEVTYLSFNEANLGINVLLTPTEVIEMVKQAGPRFNELGLKTKWLLGDCSNILECPTYVKAIWAEESVRPYFGVVAFHSWDAYNNQADRPLSELADFGKQIGLEVWCTEAGWDPALWQRPEEFPTWINARHLAIAYSRSLKLGGATVMFYWQMMGHDYNINDGAKPYLVMDVIREFKIYFPERSQIVGTSPNKGSVYSVAATTPRGFALHMVNDSTSQNVRITGLPNGDYDLLLTKEGQVEQLVLTTSVTDGSLVIELPAFSINILINHK